MPHQGASEDEPSIVIPSSVVMLAGAVLGGLIAVLISAGLFLAHGVNAATLIVGLIVAGLVWVVLFDVPVSAKFDREGVERRAILRRHVIRWERVRRLTRMRVGVVRTLRWEVRGGLVAEVGGRSYVLVDRTESPIEFDELRRVLGDRADRLGLGQALRPGYRDPERSPVWSRRFGRRR